jgi:hypothetical protein
VQRLRDVEFRQVPDNAIPVLARLDEPAVEKHPNRLDRIQRRPVGPLADSLDLVVGKAGHEPPQELVDRRVGEGVEGHGREVPEIGAPACVPLGDLGPRERDDIDRMAARPVEQVLDELDEGRVGPVHVLEHHDDRVPVGHSLDEQPPCREEVLAIGRHAFSEPEEMLEPWFDERTLLGIRDDL